MPLIALPTADAIVNTSYVRWNGAYRRDFPEVQRLKMASTCVSFQTQKQGRTETGIFGVRPERWFLFIFNSHLRLYLSSLRGA